MRGLKIKDCTVGSAQRWIAEVHRHLPKIQGGLFACAVALKGERVGVALAANPARKWQGTGRFVIARVAVQPGLLWEDDRHAAPYCTMLYGALCRAGKALGYNEAWTYTLESEPGTSLRAAGFHFMGYSAGGTYHESRPGRTTVQAGRKGRWARGLYPAFDEALRLEASKLAVKGRKE
jgi:hypothetical protein